MSNILNKVVFQEGSTNTIYNIVGARPCYGPYVDQSTGKITDLYEDAELLLFVDKIEMVIYVSMVDGSLYTYIPNDNSYPQSLRDTFIHLGGTVLYAQGTLSSGQTSVTIDKPTEVRYAPSGLVYFTDIYAGNGANYESITDNGSYITVTFKEAPSTNVAVYARFEQMV